MSTIVTLLQARESKVKMAAVKTMTLPAGDWEFVRHLGDRWVGLIIGNSRLHWASFEGHQLRRTWDVSHLDLTTRRPQSWLEWQHYSPAFASSLEPFPTLWVVSVVPQQQHWWAAYPRCQTLTLTDIPLAGLYPTLGLDRALAAWVAGQTYGWPTLVIDAGTALTLTGADSQRLLGGAILPGLSLQMRSLDQGTAELPLGSLPESLPPAWATDTQGAIESGVIRGTVMGLCSLIETWLVQYPLTHLVLTGGDSQRLDAYLGQVVSQSSRHAWIHSLKLDATLLLEGMQQVVSLKS